MYKQHTGQVSMLESGERGEIRSHFGVGKRRFPLDCIVTELKETCEVMNHSIVIHMNLRKTPRLLFTLYFQPAPKGDSDPAGRDVFSPEKRHLRR